MKQVLSRIPAITILILHLGLSLTDIQHFDSLVTAAGTQDAFASHDCGSRELHTNLDAVHFCIPCHRTHAGVVFQNEPSAALILPEQDLLPAPSFEIFFAGFSPQTYHRGPPFLHLLT